MLYPVLDHYVHQIRSEYLIIEEARRKQLDQLAHYILDNKDALVRLNFICTHNSRRSIISQIWAATAAIYFGFDHVTTFSGGTESTAFNERAVAAMERAGFKIESGGGNNPHYLVSFGEASAPFECFSKKYDAPANPDSAFAAIMTCDHADQNCPFIPGAAWRLSLPYKDPKEADGTPQEAERYDERVRQIGRELFYTFEQLNL